MNTLQYHKRIKLKYWLLSFFYDLVEIFFSSSTETNPRHGLARLIPNHDLRVLDVCFGSGNSTQLDANTNNRNMITGLDLSADIHPRRAGESEEEKSPATSGSTDCEDAQGAERIREIAIECLGNERTRPGASSAPMSPPARRGGNFS